MSKKLFVLGLLLISSALLISGCNINVEVSADEREVLRGSGNLVTEDRTVSGFERVSLTGAGDVIITQGEAEALTVKADDNLMPYIKTEVKNGTLVLGFTEEARHWNIRPSQGIAFQLSAKEITALDLSGAGNIRAAALDAERLEVRLTGAGDVRIDELGAEALDAHLSGAGSFELAGQVKEQDVRLSGAGDYRAGNLQSERASVALSGVGSATVWATETLDTQLTGVGSIRYYGHPTITSRNVAVGGLVSLGDR